MNTNTMMIWHVVHGQSPIRSMLRRGLKNFVTSAWSHYKSNAPFSEWQVGMVRASGGRIFIDSGALSGLRHDVSWLDRQDAVAQLARDVSADLVAHLDVPMERHGLRAAHITRSRALEITIRNAVAFMDADVGQAEKVYVIQGWTLDEYKSCLRSFYDHGIPDAPNGLGLGTCCMRKGTRGLWQIAEWATAATNGFWLHAFGVGDLSKIPRLAALGYDSLDEGNTVRAIIYRHDATLAKLMASYRGFDA